MDDALIFIIHFDNEAQYKLLLLSFISINSHGASGDCGPIGKSHISSVVEDTGPFDLDDGEEYISVYVGN